MGRPFAEGQTAKYKYGEVRYSHFGSGPGDSYLLAADPWSFLAAWLAQHRPKRGERRIAFQRASYFAGLAESFYKAAAQTEMPAQAPLTYYGMLNLLKCFLSVRRVVLESTWEHHGLSLPLGQAQIVEVNKHAADHVSIFHEFASALGRGVQQKHSIGLSEVVGQIPELHEIAYSLGHLPGKKRKFLPVRIAFLVNEAKTQVFTEVQYEKKNEARVRVDKFLRGARGSYLKLVTGDADPVVYRGKRHPLRGTDSWPKVFKRICTAYSGFDLASILSKDGYAYYCDLEPGPYPHLCYTLMLAFYIGSVTRYRPSETEQLLDSDWKPIVSEVLAVCPGQFLYHLVSLITQRICVVPHALL